MKLFSRNYDSKALLVGSPLQAEHDRLASQTPLALAYEAPTKQSNDTMFNRVISTALKSFTVAHSSTTAGATLPAGHGPCPSGVLIVSSSSTPCPGFPKCSTIQLEYKVPSGTQLAFHPRPGSPYEGTHRRGYLPDNAAGRQLLTRYKVVWWRGLSLDVGYSAVLQKDHQVRWTDAVPHKTSLKGGGAFGFPDSNFLANANNSLDQIGIPDADACLALLFPPPPQEEKENINSTPVDDFFYNLPTQLDGIVPLTAPTSTFGPKAVFVVPPPKESSVSFQEANKNAAEERRKQLESQEKRKERRKKVVKGVVAVAGVAGRVAGAFLEGASDSGSGSCGCDDGGGGDGGGD